MTGESEYFEQGLIFHGFINDVAGSKLDLMTVGQSREDAQAMWKEVEAAAGTPAAVLNGNDPDSEIGRFNAGKMLAHSPVSDELGEVIDICKEYRELTSGLFDVALGKMSLVDHDEEDGSLSVYGAKLDFGSFSRGWFLRKCAAAMDKAGVDCAFVNLGNFAFVARGHHPYGEAWKVNLSNPFTRMPLEEVALTDCAMALSCNAPGCMGKVVHPRTLKGNEDRKMVVVKSPDPLEAKVLATSMMIASAQEAEQLRSSFPESEITTYNL